MATGRCDRAGPETTAGGRLAGAGELEVRTTDGADRHRSSWSRLSELGPVHFIAIGGSGMNGIASTMLPAGLR